MVFGDVVVSVLTSSFIGRSVRSWLRNVCFQCQEGSALFYAVGGTLTRPSVLNVLLFSTTLSSW